MYVKLIQELLDYVRYTCPDIYKHSEKLVTVTPINKKKTVRFMDTITSSRNIPKHPVKGARALSSVCNECLFDANHAMCLIDHVNSMNVHAKSASKKNKKRKEWKPTGKVFNSIGYKWKPTGRIFTLVGNTCDLTRLNATVRNIRTNNGTEFVNQTLRDYYEQVGISHETSVACTQQQNGVAERRNRILVEAIRTMLIYAKAPLFLWAYPVATACYTQN
uniref:Putative ribonuclease H-like domain-containing protein n=1 Tax=Tanacetum cinerariifolium TaxID=118510 RepID=A0A699I8S3_TANCI|nr:putative ribonuclease H-like domain-containing protein [Tanacetum cinerariifolium]